MNGDISEAKIHFQKATEVDQNYAHAYFNLGRLCSLNPSEFDQAFRNLETALEIDPDFEDCHYYFGKLLTSGAQVTKDGSLVHKPDHKAAEDHFRQAIRINPKSATALFELGKLLFTKKMFFEAFQALEKSIKIDPRFADAHYELAVILMNEKASKIISQKLTSSRKKKIQK